MRAATESHGTVTSGNAGSAEVSRAVWTEAGPHEVYKGIHRIPLPLPGDGLQAVNVYALVGAGELVLVDTGSAHADTSAALEAALRQLGAELGDVTTILCTHAHYDHYGLASTIRRVSNAPVGLGRTELAALDVALQRETYTAWQEERRQDLVSHGAETVADGADAAGADEFDSIHAQDDWGPPDFLVEDGDQLQLAGRELRAILTPGHTRGHLMFLSSDGILFAGDHVLPHITPSLGFEPRPDGQALARFLTSLHAVRDLPARLVLPGHGPAFEGLARRVDELVSHHAERLDACVLAFEDRPASTSAATVARRLPWTRRNRPFDELGPFDQVLAVSETITHLELLVERGSAVRVDRNRVLYTLAPGAGPCISH